MTAAGSLGSQQRERPTDLVPAPGRTAPVRRENPPRSWPRPVPQVVADAAVSCRRLRHVVDDRLVLDDVSFDVPAGAAYGLLGKPAPPFVIVPAMTITRANLVEGYRESLNRAPPASVMKALGK